MLKRTKIIIASTIGVILLSVGGVFAYSLLSGGGGTSDVTNVDDPRLVNRYDTKKSGDSVSFVLVNSLIFITLLISKQLLFSIVVSSMSQMYKVIPIYLYYSQLYITTV